MRHREPEANILQQIWCSPSPLPRSFHPMENEEENGLPHVLRRGSHQLLREHRSHPAQAATLLCKIHRSRGKHQAPEDCFAGRTEGLREVLEASRVLLAEAITEATHSARHRHQQGRGASAQRAGKCDDKRSRWGCSVSCTRGTTKNREEGDAKEARRPKGKRDTVEGQATAKKKRKDARINERRNTGAQGWRHAPRPEGRE